MNFVSRIIYFFNEESHSIVAGIVSGLIVSLICFIVNCCRIKRENRNKDIQKYCRFLDTIIMHIDNILIQRKDKMLVNEIIKYQPITKSFKKNRNSNKVNKEFMKASKIYERIVAGKYNKSDLKRFKTKLKKLQLNLIDEK